MKLVRSIFLALAVMFAAQTVRAADAPAGDAAGGEAKKEKKAKKGKKAEGGEEKKDDKAAK
jgi:hypothetical protein